jgi:hypothetical protein
MNDIPKPKPILKTPEEKNRITYKDTEEKIDSQELDEFNMSLSDEMKENKSLWEEILIGKLKTYDKSECDVLIEDHTEKLADYLNLDMDELRPEEALDILRKNLDNLPEVERTIACASVESDIDFNIEQRAIVDKIIRIQTNDRLKFYQKPYMIKTLLESIEDDNVRENIQSLFVGLPLNNSAENLKARGQDIKKDKESGAE